MPAQRIPKRVVEQTEELLDKLVADGRLELARSHDRARLVADAAAFLQELGPQTHRGGELGDWLSSQRGVAEVFADDDELEAAVAAWVEALGTPKRRPAPTHASDARDPVLEARVIAEPDDLDAVAVYRDWLIEHGNPLGDLFAFGDSPKARQQTLAAHAHYLWGAVYDYRQLFKVDWGPTGAHAIAITRVSEIEIEWPIMVAWLLDLPLTIFLRELRIGPLPRGSLSAVEGIASAILARPRQALRALHLDASLERHRCDLGALADLEGALPNLRTLHLVGRRASITLDHQTLESAVVRLDAASAAAATSLASATCPALRDLTLELGLIEPFPVEALFAARGFPSLARLQLAIAPVDGEQIVRGVLEAPWLPQLRELDISANRLVDGAVRLLSRGRARLAHLERLVVDVPDVRADVRAWPNVVHRSRSF